MNLQYDATQAMLRDSAERFLKDNYDAKVFRTATEGSGFTPAIWSEFAKLGWLGLPFAEDVGGAGGGPLDVAILMEAFGKSLVVEPYVASIVLAGGLVQALGRPDQRQTLLAPLIEGREILALAHTDRGAATEAKASGGGYLLSGAKQTVLAAPLAATLLVSATLASGALAVFAIPAATRGVVVRPYRTIDSGSAADVDLVDVALPRDAILGDERDASGAVTLAIDRAIAAASADAVGAIAAMVQTTVDYTKTRVQFGQPLSKFQALQFRMVEMKVREEEARASGLLATLSLDGPADKRTRAVSGAKAKIGRSARFVAQNAIQTHGAIGTTNELMLGNYAKRLMAYEINFGSTREHLRRYAALMADPALAAAGLLLEPA